MPASRETSLEKQDNSWLINLDFNIELFYNPGPRCWTGDMKRVSAYLN